MKKRSLLWKCKGLQSWQTWPAISVSCRLSLLGSSMDKAWNLFMQEDSNINKNIKMHSTLRGLKQKITKSRLTWATYKASSCLKSPHIHMCVRVYVFMETEAVPSVAEVTSFSSCKRHSFNHSLYPYSKQGLQKLHSSPPECVLFNHHKHPMKGSGKVTYHGPQGKWGGGGPWPC